MDEEEEVLSPGRIPARQGAHLEPGTGVASHHIALAKTGQHVGDGSHADDEINFPGTDLGSDATPINVFSAQMNGGGSSKMI